MKSNLALVPDFVEQSRHLIEAIDLSMVKLKLMDKDEGLGWTAEQTDRAEQRYRRFMFMLCTNRHTSFIVPTKDIDLFWHQHILDTRAYMSDCERVFGEYIHHFPYYGMRGEEDAANLLSSFEETKALYARIFGEPYVDGDGPGATTCHKCGSGRCHKCRA